MTVQKTALTHDRGWASPAAAASIHRIDAQLGRPADINEAGRSREKADENYRKWLEYLAGGPWAPFALPADESVHVTGDAADSDDWYDPVAAAVWYDNGWRQTARYPGNPKKDEPWHGEHFEHLDNHRNDPIPTILTGVPMSALRIITSPYYRAAKQMVIHNGSVAKSIPNNVGLPLRQAGVESKDYDAEQEFNNELTEVWALGNIDRDAMADEFGDRIKKQNTTP